MKPLLTFLLLIFCLTIVHAQSADTTKQIDALFSAWNNATPGGAVIISRSNQVIYNKAFGLADMEHNAPNTTETIFEAGSVSKQFTAAAALLLASEGKLAVTDDVRKYIPELPKYNAPITIQHLLNHTSGLKDWGSVGGLTGWPRTTRVYTNELALDIICRQRSLNFTPGAEYSYSNSNYTLLVFIVERVSGRSLADFTHTQFFEPLGMTHTQWRDNFREIIPNRATAYSGMGNSYEQNMPFENVHGHGGLLTTTGDLLKWNKILETHQIGGDQVATNRLRKGKLNSGKEITYASGIVVGEFNGFVEIAHSGATAGYRAWLAYYPKRKITIALLSNDGSFAPASAGRAIAAVFLGKQEEAKTKPALVTLSENELKKFAGTYKSIRGSDVITFEYKDSKLWSDGDEIRAIHRDTLYLDGVRCYPVKSNVIMINNFQDTTSYRRVNPPDLKLPVYPNGSLLVTHTSVQSLAGSYYSEEAEAAYKVEIKNNAVWINRKPGESFVINPLFQDGYKSDDNELFEFRRDKKGAVIGFDVSVTRAERVSFVKRK